MSIIDMVKKEKRDREEIEERMEELCNRIQERASIVIPQNQTRETSPYTVPRASIALGVSPRSHRKAAYLLSPAFMRERRGVRFTIGRY